MAELGTLKDLANLLAADAPVTACLKNENALPCACGLYVDFDALGERRTGYRKKQGNYKSLCKFHGAIIPKICAEGEGLRRTSRGIFAAVSTCRKRLI